MNIYAALRRQDSNKSVTCYSFSCFTYVRLCLFLAIGCCLSIGRHKSCSAHPPRRAYTLLHPQLWGQQTGGVAVCSGCVFMRYNPSCGSPSLLLLCSENRHANEGCLLLTDVQKGMRDLMEFMWCTQMKKSMMMMTREFHVCKKLLISQRWVGLGEWNWAVTKPRIW